MILVSLKSSESHFVLKINYTVLNAQRRGWRRWKAEITSFQTTLLSSLGAKSKVISEKIKFCFFFRKYCFSLFFFFTEAEDFFTKSPFFNITNAFYTVWRQMYFDSWIKIISKTLFCLIRRQRQGPAICFLHLMLKNMDFLAGRKAISGSGKLTGLVWDEKGADRKQ